MPMGMPDAYIPKLAAVPYRCKTMYGSEMCGMTYDDIALSRRELKLIGELRCPC
jgi:hypothetical protein